MLWGPKPSRAPCVSYIPQQQPEPKPHVHSSDSNYRFEPKIKKMHRCATGFGVMTWTEHVLSTERVCSECKCRYFDEVKIPPAIFDFIQSKPKAAKELGIT
jgi:hypothetical protein